MESMLLCRHPVNIPLYKSCSCNYQEHLGIYVVVEAIYEFIVIEIVLFFAIPGNMWSPCRYSGNIWIFGIEGVCCLCHFKKDFESKPLSSMFCHYQCDWSFYLFYVVCLTRRATKGKSLPRKTRVGSESRLCAIGG